LDKHGKLYRIHKRLLYCKNIPQSPQFFAVTIAMILLANRSPQWSYGVRSKGLAAGAAHFGPPNFQVARKSAGSSPRVLSDGVPIWPRR